MSVTAAAPDYAEPFVGWRVWSVVETEDALRLRSVVFDAVWPARERLTASCLRRRLRLPWRRGELAHAAPVEPCSCGIYASTLQRLASYLDCEFERRRFDRVLGQVFLWGAVVECQQGWRASLAYPARLYVPTRRPDGVQLSDAEDLAFALTDYGVPVVLLDCGRPGEVIDAVSAVAYG